MKRCPECYEIYEGSETFCEVDGQPLLFDPAFSVPGEATQRSDLSQFKREFWTTGIIGAMVGIIVCLGVVAGFSVWTLQSDSEDKDNYPTVTRTLEPTLSAPPARSRIPEPEASESPSPEDEPSPELTPQPSPGTETQVASARLNEGPIRTGERLKERETTAGQTIIQMHDGSTLEVDAAWEDGQGIWYRRGGLVSFLEGRLVKAITARPAPNTAPGSRQ